MMSSLKEAAMDGKICLEELLKIINIHWNSDIARSVYFQFMVMDTDEERVSFAMRFIKGKDFNLTDDVDGSKSLSRSVEFRRKGNTAFNAGSYNAALEWYTKSVATAPYPDTNLMALEGTSVQDFEALTALSLAVANRSNIFFKLKKYESCMKDISFALEMNYPEDLHFKLHVRRVRCLQALEKFEEIQDNIQVALKSLSHTDKITEKGKEKLKCELEMIRKESLKSQQTNKKDANGPQNISHENITLGENSFYSDCTEVKLTESMGRGLFATRDIQPGDIVLIEKPFGAVLKEKYFHSNCYECFRLCGSLIPCKHCSLVMFCSEECYEMSWEKYHHLECSILPILVHMKILFLGSLALRNVITASKMFSSLTEFYENVSQFYNKKEIQENFQNSRFSDYLEVLNLFRKKHCSEHMLMFSIYVAFLIYLLERTKFFQQNSTSGGENSIPMEKLKNFVGCLLLRHILNQTHKIGIAKEMGDDFEILNVGNAMYPKASLINHSCAPNVFHYMYNGSQIAIRAWRVIKQGEQIFDSYGPAFTVDPLGERRKFLLEAYEFHCLCTACEQDWPLRDKLLFIPQRLKCKYCTREFDNNLYSTWAVCEICHKITTVNEVSEKVKVAVMKLCDIKENGNINLTDITETLEILNACICRPSYEMYLCETFLMDYFLTVDYKSNFKI